MARKKKTSVPNKPPLSFPSKDSSGSLEPNITTEYTPDPELAPRYESMRIPLYLVPFSVDLVEHFPVLNRFAVFRPDGITASLADQYIRFAVYAFDRFSPLQDDLPTDTDRQVEAAIMAGFSHDSDGIFSDGRIQSIIDDGFGDGGILSSIILCYVCQLQSSDQWAKYCILRQQLFDAQQQLASRVTEVDIKSKSAVVEDIYFKREKLFQVTEQYEQRLEVLEKKLFRNNASLVREAKVEAFMWTPEYVADMKLHYR